MELPNGLRIFNATPHVVRFWREEWDEPVEVASDEIISAKVEERFIRYFLGSHDAVSLVCPVFVGTDAGREIARKALADGAHIVVGSIIAAQAYPGLVVGMTPAPGYERVPPAEKRMDPNKFTIFE